jgi:hypothetical protein
MSNPTPQPDNNYDPAGNTQMFRAFVDEQQQPPAQVQRAQTRSRAGLIIGLIVAVVVIVGVVALAVM